jgi:hypothetical protein
MHSVAELPERDLSYIPIAKNGSSSVLKTLWDGPVNVRDKRWCNEVRTSKAVVMWREPTARAWSAYQMLVGRGQTQNADDPRRPWFPDIDLYWDEWLQVLARERYHMGTSATLIPQSEYLCSPVEYEYVAWDFQALGEKLGVELPHLNEARKPLIQPDITPEMLANLHLIYSADYRIWELIT